MAMLNNQRWYTHLSTLSHSNPWSNQPQAAAKNPARARPRLHTNTLRRPPETVAPKNCCLAKRWAPKISEIAGRNPNENHKKYMEVSWNAGSSL